MVVLREFLYRADDLVSQFLEQLEGGGFDEQRVTDQTNRSSGFGASGTLGPIGASGERRTGESSESELTMRQTPASRFNRLHQLLAHGQAIQELLGLDDEIWDQLSRNEIVEVEADLRLLDGVLQMEQVSQAAGLAPLLEGIMNLPDEIRPDNVDLGEARTMAAQLPAIQGIADAFKDGPVPCTFTPAAAPRYVFFSELNRSGLVVPTSELEGEVTVLAKLTRFIVPGKPEVVGQPVPGVSLSRAQRRKSGNNSTGAMTIKLKHPAAVVTTVAIYR